MVRVRVHFKIIRVLQEGALPQIIHSGNGN